MATLAKRRTESFATVLVADAGLDAIAGAWLFLSAFLFFNGTDAMFVNNLTCGALAAILAFGAFAHIRFAWLPAAIGFWVMIAPFALGFGISPFGLRFSMNTLATLNNVMTGAVILSIAIHEWRVTKSAHEAGMMGE